jgi:hypothetical protein
MRRILRSVVIAAAIQHLPGERNWYLPAWLEWLPRLEIEEAGPARRRARAAVN